MQATGTYILLRRARRKQKGRITQTSLICLTIPATISLTLKCLNHTLMRRLYSPFCFCLYTYPYLSPLNNTIACVVCLAVRTWHPHPLDLTIVEILEKKGAMTDAELFDVLRETREDLGFGALNKTLMKMEVAGLVYVSSLTKGKRRVELVKRKE